MGALSRARQEAARFMITGFNHNIKYQNRVYHIQTEDSGVKNPHIITHVFVGGNIIATRKSDYSALMAATAPHKLGDAIRNSMEEQHKGMLRSLIHGKFDGALNAAGAHHLDGPAPLNVDSATLARTGGSGNKGPDSNPTLAPVAAPPSPAVPPLLLTHPKPVCSKAVTLPGIPMPLLTAPKVILGARPAPAPVDLAPEVLAARMLPERPAEKPVMGDTIFGEDIISEKSLDEVILSYLAEELK